jgi:hypothetical protein
MRSLVSVAVALQLLTTAGRVTDPFAFFRPTVHLSADDREKLGRGEPVVSLLQASGHEIGAFMAITVDPGVTIDRAAAWMRRVELLRENPYVLASQRLSSPPQLSDFDRLALDDEDLADIQRCSPGRCGLKLSGNEIRELHAVISAARADWKPALQSAFRQVLLRRVLAFTVGGQAGLSDIWDKKRPVAAAAAFAPLLEHSAFLAERPDLASRLPRCTSSPGLATEAFMYWSKERLGGRAVIIVTHVVLVNGGAGGRPPLLMIGTQVYASHYLDASLTVTAFVEEQPSSRAYFIYFHRSSVDLLGGFWGPLARSIIESTIRKDGPALLRGVGARLAIGEPPGGSPRHAWPSR